MRVGDLAFLPKRAPLRPRGAPLRLGGAARTSRRDGGSPACISSGSQRVRCRGIDRTKPGCGPEPARRSPSTRPTRRPGTATLIFAEGGAIQLDLECVEVQMKDLGPVWACRRASRSTRCRPAERAVMPQRLDARDASLPARLRQPCSGQARGLRGRRRGRPRDHRRRGGAGRRRADRVHAALRRARPDRRDACAIGDAEIEAALAACDAGEDSPRSGLAKERIEAYHRAQRPETTLTTDAARRHAWAGAGRRSNRSVSTCPAARRAIPLPS